MSDTSSAHDAEAVQCDFCCRTDGQIAVVPGGGKVVVRISLVAGERMCQWCRWKAQRKRWK